MGSVTSSCAPKTLALDRFTASLKSALICGPVPLLVIRLPHFEHIAWRDGKGAARRLERRVAAAFAQVAGRALRAGDLTGHERGSEIFLIALSSPSRNAQDARAPDCRSVLERAAAAMSLDADARIETGWTWLRGVACRADLQRGVEAALERGARERERYEFFAAVGHELRTPLTSIRGYLETLIDGGLDPPTGRRFLETARRETLRMGRLLDGMFEFSLLDLSARALAARNCDVAAQIQAACDVVRPLARTRGVTLRCAPCEAAQVTIDEDALLQLLVNLLENAIKYGRDGGTVQIGARRAAREVVIAVDDDGAGVVPHERDRIFNLRVRGTHSGGRPGTGIGLAIVKMIAERAGGCISVRSSPLGGARFEAVLPLGADFAVPSS
jgi:signal transduction histidine kinase